MAHIKGSVDTYKVPENSKDISQIFYAANYAKSPFFESMSVGDAVRSTEYKWWEDILLPASTITTAAIVANASTIAVASTAGIRDGSILKIKENIYRVVGDVASGATTVNVISLNTCVAVTEASALVEINLNARLEGSDLQKSDYAQKTVIENVTQIIDDSVEVTETQKAVSNDLNISDMVIREVDKKLSRIQYALARAVWHNVLVKPTDNATPRVFGGIYDMIERHGYITSAAFSQDNFDAWLTSCADRGSAIEEVWLNPYDLAKFANLLVSPTQPIMPTGQDITVGYIPTMYRSKHGWHVKLMTDANCKVGTFSLLKSSDVYLKPLQTRQFQTKDISVSKDSAVVKIIGEYTLEINPVKKMSLMNLV